MLGMIRTEFRKPHKNDMNPAQINELLVKAESNISYLKMITPSKIAVNHKDSGEVSTSDGNRGRSGSRVHSNWTGSNMDPDSVARHNASLKRAGFRNNSHAKGGMF